MAVFCICLVVQVCSLWLSGAFHAEFGAHPDEPAHFITGLMARDYFAAGAPSSPMKFAEDYYLHYPKVALGHYPPFMYVVEAAWLLFFPPWRISLLMLQALLLAAAGATLYASLRRQFHPLLSAAAAVLLILTPTVQLSAAMVMQETLTLLLVLAAVLRWGRYLEHQRWQDAALFGVFASLAILTKQVALFLALVPPITIAFTRRFGLLRRLHFWAPVPVVLALCVPWYLYARTLIVKKAAYVAGTDLAIPPFFAQALGLAGASGTALLLVAMLGLWLNALWPALRGKAIEPGWAAWSALGAGFLVFRFVAPAAFEVRHLIYLQPSVAAFAAAGASWLMKGSEPGGLVAVKRALLVVLLAGLVAGVWKQGASQQRYVGFSEAAEELLKDPRYRRSGLLVSSDASGEGAFIAEVAAREARPGHIVLRANKMLASMSWSGNVYQVRYETPEKIQQYLESVPAAILVLDLTESQPRTEHRRLVEAAVSRYADRWRLIGVYPQRRAASPKGAVVRVYALAGHESEPPGNIQVDLTDQLGRFVGE